MSDSMKDTPARAFQGRWIGETQGCESAAHLWEIELLGSHVLINCCWEGEVVTNAFYGTLLPDQAAIAIDNWVATLIDAEHFVIKGWVGPFDDESAAPGGPPFDVVFSRPGLAELTADRAYRQWLAATNAG